MERHLKARSGQKKKRIMQTRGLGSTDLNLSVIGFGTWALGGTGWKYSCVEDLRPIAEK